MTGGFQHDIAGGGGNLIATSVQSPNFLTGSAGWQIRKDGSAEFNNAVIRGTITAGTFQGTDFIINTAGAFFYSGTPAAGNLFASIASSAGTDSFGNGYGAGFESYGGSGGAAQITSGTIGLFSGLNVVCEMTPAGFFLYSPSGGLGNLIISSAAAAGTDSFGNAYVQGFGAYITISATKYILTFGQQNSIPGMSIQQASSGPVFPPLYGADAASSAGCSAYINSGQATVAAVPSVVQVQDSVQSAVSNGVVAMITGQVQMGSSGAAVWNDNAQQFNLPASGGPFIQGEGFHGVSLASGMSNGLPGGTGVRVKKLPWNAIWIEVESAISTTSTTLNLGTLPDSSYYPGTTRHFPIVTTGSVTGRLFVPTTGNLQIIVTASANGLNIGCAHMYATN